MIDSGEINPKDYIVSNLFEGQGWRVFFYSNEGHEPIHIHARKGDAECKYGFNTSLYEISEVWSFNFTPELRREIRKISFDNFDLIVDKWTDRFGTNAAPNDEDVVLAKSINRQDDYMVLLISSLDIEVGIPWNKCSKGMAAASKEQQLNCELSPGGYGIHWPDLEEDLSIGGLVATVLNS
jgi:hypothetical protein